MPAARLRAAPRPAKPYGLAELERMVLRLGGTAAGGP
jgi:hypothetical protein